MGHLEEGHERIDLERLRLLVAGRTVDILSASIYMRVEGLRALCSVLCGRLTSRPVGNTKVEVTIKKMSRRNITSVIEAIEKADIMEC